MKTSFSLDDDKLKDIDATMVITMSIDEWMNLQEQLRENYPSYNFGQEIKKVLDHVEKHFDNED